MWRLLFWKMIVFCLKVLLVRFFWIFFFIMIWVELLNYFVFRVLFSCWLVWCVVLWIIVCLGVFGFLRKKLMLWVDFWDCRYSVFMVLFIVIILMVMFCCCRYVDIVLRVWMMMFWFILEDVCWIGLLFVLWYIGGIIIGFLVGIEICISCCGCCFGCICNFVFWGVGLELLYFIVMIYEIILIKFEEYDNVIILCCIVLWLYKCRRN